MKSTGERSPFEKEVARAGRQLRKAQDSFEAVNQKLGAGDADGAYISAFDFADAAEKLTLTARYLPAYTGNPQAAKASEQIVLRNAPVRMGFTPEGWFGLVIPSLLPKKSRGSTDYIRDMLYFHMRSFFRGKPPVRYTDCVMIFRHIYKRDRPERQYRDHDNIEINMAADAIALYVLFDDSAIRCFHYYCSAPGDEYRTEIFVVPQREFVAWIVDAEKQKNKAVVLHDHPPKSAKKHM